MKHHLIIDAGGIPPEVTLTGSDRRGIIRLIPLVEAVPPVRGRRDRPRRRLREAFTDRGLPGCTLSEDHGPAASTAPTSTPVDPSSQQAPSLQLTRVRGHLASFGRPLAAGSSTPLWSGVVAPPQSGCARDHAPESAASQQIVRKPPDSGHHLLTPFSDESAG